MSYYNLLNLLFGGQHIIGTEKNDLIIDFFGDDKIEGNGANDLIIDLFGDDDLFGGLGDDKIFAGFGDDTASGGLGEDWLYGNAGDDEIAGNKGDDQMFGGSGDDRLVWNNGDGSDLMVGGLGYDRVQVNFDTDLVNDDLQNADVAAFSVTDNGVHFARIELNGQTERGLFQLDIRETETQETNFGAGDDKAVIVGTVLDKITLDLDGGDGVDALDLSQAAEAIKVNLKKGELGQSTAVNFENVIGTDFDDTLIGDKQDNEISGGSGVDKILGKGGDDLVIGNKGDDIVKGGGGDDLLVWNNGDGSDLMKGGKGYDTVQVNFDTDLVNDDLQNKDTAAFSVTNKGVQFARTEVNDQTEKGLFKLDIRNNEEIETNFGGGDDTAVIVDDALNQIRLDLDGGDGVDLLDLSQASEAANVNLAAGTLGASTVQNFENVTGTAFADEIIGDDQANVIRGGAGNDVLTGGDGEDVFVFFEADAGFDVITDFEFGEDSLLFVTNDPNVTTENLLTNLTQAGDNVELTLNNKLITFEDTVVDAFQTDDFMIA